jgi:predicted dehydrogenase
MKKRYAICGVSGRALGMFAKPIATTYSQTCEVVGLLDRDPKRFELYQTRFPEDSSVKTYGELEFDRMVAETRPDVIIVAGRDDSHAKYIIAALERDLDVITEKPMVTTGEDCRMLSNPARGGLRLPSITDIHPYIQKSKK